MPATPAVHPLFIYYSVYLLCGLISSKSAFDGGNPFVGRILARSVPPPHTVKSLKRCFAHAEGFPFPDTLTELYADPAQ
ncbi:hypothetical protein FB451DRAFT_1264616 [Mycena latifolia]|nr:hypothetical protein FB451DRAFT_1264616 [Mycena latifolia]